MPGKSLTKSQLRTETTARSRKCSKRFIGFEGLESRSLLAITFKFDYSLDSNMFFNTSEKKQALEIAGKMVGDLFSDTLKEIKPSGANKWSVSIFHPATGKEQLISNVTIPANTIVIYAGGRDISGLGLGGTAGYKSLSGSSSFLDLVKTRGQASTASGKDVSPFAGHITFDTVGTNWFFGQTNEGLKSNQADFISVAVHELMHVVGFTSGNRSFSRYVSGTSFTGPSSKASYGGSVPLASGNSHWKEGALSFGLEASMDPTLTNGTRKLLTPLDVAGLNDLGWVIDTASDSIFKANHVLTGGSKAATASLSSSLSSSKQFRVFRVYMPKDKTFSIDVTPSTSTLDTYVRVFDTSGKILKQGGDGAQGKTDKLSYKSTRSDFYYVGISSVGNKSYNPLVINSGRGGTTGSFNVKLTA